MVKLRHQRSKDHHGLKTSDYKHYLHSAHWRITKQEFYTSDSFTGRCGYCDRRHDSYDLHHTDYSNLGEEPFSHLVALCRDCHYKVHDFLYENKKVALSEAIGIMRKQNKKNVVKKKTIKQHNPLQRKPYNIQTPAYRNAYEKLKELGLSSVYDEETDNKARKRLRKFAMANQTKREKLLKTWTKQSHKKNPTINPKEVAALTAIIEPHSFRQYW